MDDPAIEAVPEPVVAPVVEPVTPEPAPDPIPAPPPRTQMVPVAVVADLREKKRQVESRADDLERQLREANAIIERQTRGQQTEAAHVVQPAQPIAADDAEINRRVNERDLARQFQSLTDTGVKAYGTQWADTVSALTAFGVNTPDFVASVMDIDGANAHKILHDIAQDGERAVQLAGLSPARRIAEITRMTMTPTAAEQPRDPAGKFVPTAPAAPAQKQVSKAPAPPPPVEPSAHKEVDWRSDEASDAEFDAGFDAMMKKRSVRR